MQVASVDDCLLYKNLVLAVKHVTLPPHNCSVIVVDVVLIQFKYT